MHKQPEIISNLPRGIVGAVITFVKHGVLFELTQFSEHQTELRCVSHCEYLNNGQWAFGTGPWPEDRYVFAELGRVLQMGNNHVVDTHLQIPPAIHAIRTKMLEDFYNFELKGTIKVHNQYPGVLTAQMPGHNMVTLEGYSSISDYLDGPTDEACNFISKGAKIRWFCRHYEALKRLFT